MTTNSGNENVTPAPGIHSLPTRTGNQGLAIAGEIEAAAQFIIEGFIGQVLIAFGGIKIAGFTPFALLSSLGQALVAQANSAYENANTAQTTADNAQAQNQNLVDFIVGALTGSSATDNPMHIVGVELTNLIQAVQTAGTSATEAWQLASNAIGQIDQAINNYVVQPIYTDTEAAIQAGFGAVGTLVGTAVSAEQSALGWIAGFFNAVTGQAQSGVTVGQAAQQAAALAEAQAAAAIAIARQQAGADGAANGGLFSDDDFERLATADLNGSVSGAWVTTTTLIAGTTAGKYTIPDGHSASFQPGSSDAQQLTVHRRTLPADAKTQTLYQKVGVIIGGFTGDGPSFGLTPPRTRIRARLNDAETQEVFCWVSVDGFAQFGYRNGSLTDTMVGSSVSIGGYAPGTAFYLIAGTTGGLRQFELVKGADGGTVVATWNDTSNVTAAVDGVNNGWGWGGYAYPGGGVPQQRPPDVGIVTIADNTQVQVLGTGCRVYRATGATVTVSAGAPYPGGLYDTADAQSASCKFNLATGQLTITKAGWWIFDVGTQSTNLPGSSKWVGCLYVGSAVKENGLEVMVAGASRTKDIYGPIYLPAGAIVSPGLLAGSAAMFVFGDTNGFNTFFSASLVSGASA